MKVCQYLTNAHPFYMKMVFNSISMLRKHNETIKVRLYLVRDEGKITFTTNHRGNELPFPKRDYLPLYKDLGVEVLEREPIDKEFFHVHRSLFEAEDSLLFIDADTFIFGDVEELFEKYKEYDYVGLPIYYLEGWDDSWLPFKPFNSAVNLWNNGWIRKFTEELPGLCEEIKGRKSIISDWCYSKCSRVTNREEMSTSLFVAKYGLKHAVWDWGQVRNSATEKDYGDAPEYIFHSFTHNWDFAQAKFCRRKRFTPRMVPAADHEAKWRKWL